MIKAKKELRLILGLFIVIVITMLILAYFENTNNILTNLANSLFN